MNQSIQCCVSSCEHNSDGQACSLNSIHVGADGTMPETAEYSHDTECSSFSAKG